MRATACRIAGAFWRVHHALDDESGRTERGPASLARSERTATSMAVARVRHPDVERARAESKQGEFGQLHPERVRSRFREDGRRAAPSPRSTPTPRAPAGWYTHR